VPPSEADSSVGAKWRWAFPGAAVAIGTYLLAWAWRWPHSDIRDGWAQIMGVFVLGVGVATFHLARKSPSRRWLVMTPAVSAAALGVWALDAVSDGQQSACGSALEACSSLLPGF
jgi:hypothetical protein